MNLLSAPDPLSRWLLGVAEHVLLGVLLSWLAGQALRALRLRWTWAPLGLGAVLLVADLPAGTAWPLAIASAFAVRGMRRREHEQRLLGDEIGQAAKARRGPLGMLALLARAAARSRRLRDGRWFCSEEVLLGYDADLRPVSAPMRSHAGGAHTLVLGAAGSGKTVTLSWLAVRAIEAGMPAVVIDPKDDPDLGERVRAAAGSAGKRLLEWSPDGPCVYNPYAEGSDSEIADKALAGERFTEPHYLRQAQRFLGVEVRSLRAAGAPISLATLAEHLDPERLAPVLRRLPEAQAAAGQAYLDSLGARQRSDLCGVRDRLAILAESDVGPWLDPRTASASSFDLLSCIRAGDVALFRLRSDQRPLIMQMLGGAIVLDLLTAAGALQGARTPSIAVIDEFAALAARHVGGLFGRARGAGMSLVLATQEISDLHLPGGESLLRQVAGNLTSTISHRQVNPESAEWVSQLAGVSPVWSATLGSDGRNAYRPSERRRVDPERVSALAPGQAVVIVHGAPRRCARVAQMLRP
jgi:conjugal transfer pilus assembly protein TraD